MSGIFDQIINYSPPLIVSGTVNYKGTWNASTNNPTLNSSPAASTKGDYYVVSTAGTQFGITFAIGDWIISNGTAWEKVDLTDAVSSVFGRTGAVVGVSTDYSAVGLTNTAIGAANPSTGAFTTITASSTIAATGAVTGSNLSGTNTGDQTTITGNAGTATALQTARTIGGSSFDGTANVTSFPVPGAIGVTTPAAANFTSIGVTTQGTGAFTTLSASGNLNFTGTGNRITGDFANATIANRVSFQNSTANSATVINALPSGTGTASGFAAYNNSDPTNAALMRIFNTGTEGAIQSGINGTGSYLPMTFYTGGSERMRINTSGNVGIGTTSPSNRLHVENNANTVAKIKTTGAGSFGALQIFNSNTNGEASIGFRDDSDADTASWVIGKSVNATDAFGWYYGGAKMTLNTSGDLTITGALSKGSGSFRIEHPLPEKSATHQLVHSFIEGPQADLIYRGKVVLVDGKASVNIDAAATMTEGTFEVLCRDVQCFTTNESGWTAVRGKVAGNILTIEAKDADCTDEISWMVIGERQDPHMMETDWTDDNGKVIVEPLKPVKPIE